MVVVNGKEENINQIKNYNYWKQIFFERCNTRGTLIIISVREANFELINFIKNLEQYIQIQMINITISIQVMCYIRLVFTLSATKMLTI